MTEQIDRRADTTRHQILRAASHQFAHKPYSSVSLDDILAEAEVTKGAMYFHFRSKHALAVAIVEHRADMAHVAVDELLARSSPRLETLIDISYFVAAEDIGDESARAGLQSPRVDRPNRRTPSECPGQMGTEPSPRLANERSVRATSSKNVIPRTSPDCSCRCTSDSGRSAIWRSPSDSSPTSRSRGYLRCPVSRILTGSSTSLSSSGGALLLL